MGYPEVFFLFDETEIETEDFKVFIYKNPSIAQTSYEEFPIDVSLVSDYHIFNRKSESMVFYQGNLESNPFEAIFLKRSNLFDGSNLRFSLKNEEYRHLKAGKANFNRVQKARAQSLVVVIEEEEAQNRFNSYAAFANGFRALPILSAVELKWFNECYAGGKKKGAIIKGDIKLVIRDYDLQFFDAYERNPSLKPKDCTDKENLVDYIRGAKDLNNKSDQKKGDWVVFETKPCNHFWKNLDTIPRVFVSKGVFHMDILTRKHVYGFYRHDKDENNANLGKFENRKEWQVVRGIKKPVSGIYSSFQRIHLIKTQYLNHVLWKKFWTKKKRNENSYNIETRRTEHDHGVPLSIYVLSKSMIDRAKWYYRHGKYVIAAIVSWDAIEVLNGFHQSLIIKAYHIHAVSENAICMNILGGNENWLRDDTLKRIVKIRTDVSRLLAAEEEKSSHSLQINVLNQIFSDCRNFCKAKEHFLSEEAFISAMGHTNDGIRFI